MVFIAIEKHTGEVVILVWVCRRHRSQSQSRTLFSDCVCACLCPYIGTSDSLTFGLYDDEGDRKM